MNLPNKLTMVRILLIPVFMVFLLYDFTPVNPLIALLIFIAASLTDLLDGKIARKQGLVTTFGKFADPLADKLLVCAALIALVGMNRLNVWFAFIIIAREFIVTGLRIVAISEGKVIAAGQSGKWKTAFQMVAVCLMLFDIILPIKIGPVLLSTVFMVIAVVLTLYSGAEYLIKNWNLMTIK